MSFHFNFLFFIDFVLFPCFFVPFRVDTLIKWHTNYIILLYEIIEVAFHKTVCSKGVFDVTTEAILGIELDRPKIFDVLWIKEHETDGCLLLVAS